MVQEEPAEAVNRDWGHFGPGLEVEPKDWRSRWEKCPGSRENAQGDRSHRRTESVGRFALCDDCGQFVRVGIRTREYLRREILRDHWRRRMT